MATCGPLRPWTRATDCWRRPETSRPTPYLDSSLPGPVTRPFRLPLGLALYVVLRKDAKGYALFGATMFTVGMTIALVHEVLRIVLSWRMPGLYQQTTEAARPAVLALGDLVVHVQDMLALIAFVIAFGVGNTVLAVGIIRTRALPRSLGWVLLVLGAGVGLVAYPLQYFRVAGASLVVLAAMMVFFLWLIAMGVALLRWRPSVVPAA